MSIAQEIEHYATGLGEAYDAVEAKLVTVTGDKNLDNLDAAIGTIPAGIPREVGDDGTFGAALVTSYKAPDDATKAGGAALYYAFYSVPSLESVDLNNIVETTGSSAFAYMCYNCTSLSSVSALKIKKVNNTASFQSAFRQCSSLTAVTFPALEEITGSSAFNQAFRNCSHLTTVSFPALTTVGTSNTNQFNNMLQQTSNVVVHFPAAMQSVIGSWADVTAGFGGTNTTVLFDL